MVVLLRIITLRILVAVVVTSSHYCRPMMFPVAGGRRSYCHTTQSTTLAMMKRTTSSSVDSHDENKAKFKNNEGNSRRKFFTQYLIANSLFYSSSTPFPAHASVGTLPEFAGTNAILQGVTIRVADQSQQQAMITFLEDGFDCEVLRKRIIGSVEETWLGFGPERLNVPSDFQLPVSSFAKYGGHASIHLVYDTKEATPFYRTGDNAPGNNIAYLQMGVPSYRISQMVKNGGNILDAYGFRQRGLTIGSSH
jgi:hypothetical protein